ncbi:chaperone protein HtpG-like [Capsicum galapagoense]
MDPITKVVSINTLKPRDYIWMIKVLVIGSGPTKPFKNGGDFRKMVILVDEEQSKVCYIINGRITRVNPNFQSVNKDIELGFLTSTIVQECHSPFSTFSFSKNFVSFEDEKLHTKETIVDIFGIFVSSKLFTKGTIRREIVLMNEECDRKTITLWGEFSEINDALLEKLSVENSVVAFCDLRTTLYQEILKATSLQEWSISQKKTHNDITLLPTKQIKRAKEMTIGEIANCLSCDKEGKYDKFTTTIAAIVNSDKPYYESCTNCYKKVKNNDNIAKCSGCPTEKITYADRFLIKVDVFVRYERCSVTLFEAAKYLVGCDVTTYKQSILEKKEESSFYQNLMLSIKKGFTFLIKIDAKSEGDRAARPFIEKEVQEVKKIVTIDIVDEDVNSKNSVNGIRKNENPNDTLSHKRIKVEKD